MIQEIHIVKLLNGDELIGKFVEETENTIIIEDPLVVEEGFNADGTTHVMLTTYVPFSRKTEKLSFNKFHVIQLLRVNGEAERYYKNSLLYNQKMVTDQQEDKLRQVNDNMEQMMKEEFTVKPAKKAKTSDRLVSKSIH